MSGGTELIIGVLIAIVILLAGEILVWLVNSASRMFHWTFYEDGDGLLKLICLPILLVLGIIWLGFWIVAAFAAIFLVKTGASWLKKLIER